MTVYVVSKVICKYEKNPNKTLKKSQNSILQACKRSSGDNVISSRGRIFAI